MSDENEVKGGLKPLRIMKSREVKGAISLRPVSKQSETKQN